MTLQLTDLEKLNLISLKIKEIEEKINYKLTVLKYLTK